MQKCETIFHNLDFFSFVKFRAIFLFLPFIPFFIVLSNFLVLSLFLLFLFEFFFGGFLLPCNPYHSSSSVSLSVLFILPHLTFFSCFLSVLFHLLFAYSLSPFYLILIVLAVTSSLFSSPFPLSHSCQPFLRFFSLSIWQTSQSSLLHEVGSQALPACYLCHCFPLFKSDYPCRNSLSSSTSSYSIGFSYSEFFYSIQNKPRLVSFVSHHVHTSRSILSMTKRS